MAEPCKDGSTTRLSRSCRLLVLGICCFSLLMVGLDTTIVNVALPSIRNDLHASVSGLQWTIDAYTLVLASLLMLAGSTADRIGRKRTFRTGLVVFSLGSLLCGLAPSLGLLIAARVLQAIGGSMLNPVAMSIIRNVFDDPRERAWAIGAWGAVLGLSMALGPVVGGALVVALSWRAVFFVNVPIGMIAFVLTTRYVPRSRAGHARRLDPVGQMLVILALASLTYAIIEAPGAGWTSAASLGRFALSLVSFVALVGYELRRHEPLLDMRFFRSAPFSGASTIAICSVAAQGGFLFLTTLYLQGVRHLSPFHAGLYMLPMAGIMFVFAPTSGRLVGSRGARWPLTIAAAALIVASVMLTRITPTTSTGDLLAAYCVFGLGLALINPPITNTAVSGMPPSQAGVAAAVASTSRQVGMTLGVAVIGAISGGAISGAIGPGFAAASHAGWWVCAGLGGVCLIVGVLTTGSWAEQTAQRAGGGLHDQALPSRDRISVRAGLRAHTRGPRAGRTVGHRASPTPATIGATARARRTARARNGPRSRASG